MTMESDLYPRKEHEVNRGDSAKVFLPFHSEDRMPLGITQRFCIVKRS